MYRKYRMLSAKCEYRMYRKYRMRSVECRMQNVMCAVCSVQIIESRTVNQEDGMYLLGSPVAPDYCPPLAGGHTHVVVKGSEGSATPIKASNL